MHRARLSKLPDKGDRIQQLYNRIEQEINARDKIDEAAKLFSDLNIAEKGLKTVTHMEWNTKAISKSNQEEIITAAAAAEDSDDDEEDRNEIDPIKILAQNRENVKIVKVVKSHKTLITDADLEEIKSFGNGSNSLEANTDSDKNSLENRSNSSLSETSSTNLEPHALYVCDMARHPEKYGNIRTKFLPHKTTKSDVHSVEKEKQRLKGKHWEITAATPPIIRNAEVKMISLQESIEVERKHKEELKVRKLNALKSEPSYSLILNFKFQTLMEQQAMERLDTRRKIVADNINLLPPGSSTLNPNEFFKTYRETNRYNDDSETEDLSNLSEYHDDDDDELDGGGVSIVTYDH